MLGHTQPKRDIRKIELGFERKSGSRPLKAKEMWESWQLFSEYRFDGLKQSSQSLECNMVSRFCSSDCILQKRGNLRFSVLIEVTLCPANAMDNVVVVVHRCFECGEGEACRHRRQLVLPRSDPESLATAGFTPAPHGADNCIRSQWPWKPRNAVCSLS